MHRESHQAEVLDYAPNPTACFISNEHGKKHEDTENLALPAVIIKAKTLVKVR